MITKNGIQPFNNAVEGVEFVALFFTNTRCGTSTKFSRTNLIPFYNKVNKDKKVMEVINVPLDDNEAAAMKTYATMPWLSA